MDEAELDYVLRYDTGDERWRLDWRDLPFSGPEPWLDAPDHIGVNDVEAAQASCDMLLAAVMIRPWRGRYQQWLTRSGDTASARPARRAGRSPPTGGADARRRR